MFPPTNKIGQDIQLEKLDSVEPINQFSYSKCLDCV